MKYDRQTMRHIKTTSALLDGRRARSPGGALLELATLANERIRLRHELDRLARRRAEIDARLGEVADKERWLRSIAEQVSGGESASLPVAELPDHICSRQLNY